MGRAFHVGKDIPKTMERTRRIRPGGGFPCSSETWMSQRQLDALSARDWSPWSRRAKTRVMVGNRVETG